MMGRGIVEEHAVLTTVTPEPGHNIDATFVYDPADPFAVTLRFGGCNTERDTHADWIFARGLIADGVDRLAGDGDVSLLPVRTPLGHQVFIKFTSDDERAVLRVRRDVLLRFIAGMRLTVPDGAEGALIGWDEWIAAVLAEASL